LWQLHPTGGQSAAVLEIKAPMSGYVFRQTEHAFVAKGQRIGNIGSPIDAA